MPIERVLVCAEPSTAEGVADALRARGYAADTASDGKTAGALAQRARPSVVLIWSDLPEADVAELVLRLREASPQARVALVLRPDRADEWASLLQVGADALVLDPPDLRFLLPTLHRQVEGGLVVDPALARALAPPPPDAGSSPEEDLEESEELRSLFTALGDGIRAAASARGPDVAPEVVPDHEAHGESETVTDTEGSDDAVLRFEEFDLAQIVRESVADASQSSPSVVVEVNAPTTLPGVGEADALRGVVRLLVGRACRRNDPGSLVTVKANRADEGITVHVIDRGTGTDQEEGGLDLPRRLVALHGGILWSEPLPAGGTRVSFTIPQEPPALDDDERQAAIQALELLAEIGAPPAPPVVEPVLEVPDEPLVEESDEPAAIMDVTDLEDLVTPTPEAPVAPFPPDSPSLADLFELEPDLLPAADVEVETEAVLDFSEEVEEPFSDSVPAVPTEPELIEPAPEPEQLIEPVPEPEQLIEPVPKPEPSPEPPQPEPVIAQVVPAEAPAEPEPVNAHVGPAEAGSEPGPGTAPPEPQEVPEPAPVSVASSSNGSRRPARRGRKKPDPVVVDPLHPASQMLRGLALDYENEPR